MTRIRTDTVQGIASVRMPASLDSYFGVALRLGRVSNLPTVWTNALAGIALAGASPWQPATVLVLLALSLFYVGGMYLNDAFDREIDACERPSRPIPSGQVTVGTVFAAGFAMILAGLALVVPAAHIAGADGTEAAVLAAVSLGGGILAYDWRHKGKWFSPLLMGACRVLAYLTAGLALAGVATPALLAAAAVALSYLIGLTYIAKQETLGRVRNLWPLLFLAAPLPYGAGLLTTGPSGWATGLLLLALLAWIAVALALLRRRQAGDIPRAVVSLIAGIALLDALFLAGHGEMAAVVVALACFAATLALQRWISGT
ncbi:MAG TPA: UbiA family prenyltransferase [Roseomonas sp.]|jgi:4-hydroxybenzoate polyprenyltransferase